MFSRVSWGITSQQDSIDSRADQTSGETQLSDTFRRLYYYLYSNSNISRAERIMDDLSLVLLAKLIEEKNILAKDELDRYRRQDGTANEILLPLLQSNFPHFIDGQHRFHLEDGLVRWAFDELSNVSLMLSPAHVIGDAFQSLLGPGLRGEKGQFFTPKSLVKAMVQVIAPMPHESVLDPACGTGGFLAEAHIYQSEIATPEGLTGHIMGVEKDNDLARFSGAILEIIASRRATIINGNSLSLEAWGNWNVQRGVGLFDVVLTNPPFGARIGIRDPEILSQFDLGHKWFKTRDGSEWHQSDAVAAYQHPQLLFLELCIRKLKPGGRLGIVLPEGVFGNKGQGYVWSWLSGQGRIFALLDCPRTTFQPSTDTKTNVLFFKKAPIEPTLFDDIDETVRVGVAIHCGHDRRGRSQLSDGAGRPDDFKRLGEQYHKWADGSSGWHDVVLTNPEYIIPRYYVDQGTLSLEERQLIGRAPTVTLADLVSSDLLSIRKGHEPGSDSYGTGNMPFIRTSDITNLELSADPTNGVSEEIYHKFATQQGLKPEDILMVVDGRYRIGTTALITENNYRCVVQSHFRILSTVDPVSLSCYELLFALNLPSVRLRIRNLTFVQSTLGTLGKRLLELKIPILSGDGPWRDRVDRFREVLLQRDRLLSEIAGTGNLEYNL